MSEYLINQYYSRLDKIIQYGGSTNESSIREAFKELLQKYAEKHGLMLISELAVNGKFDKPVTPDGTFKNPMRIEYGYWESKDEKDNLYDEIENKIKKGYPLGNILFEDSNTAVLYQYGVEVLSVNMKDAGQLAGILDKFFEYEHPEVKEFNQALGKFQEDLPHIIGALRDMIAEEAKSNKAYITARDNFLENCKTEINPEFTAEDVREMVIQHILTEEIFNAVFDESHFHMENNIARQLDSLIKTFFTGAKRRNMLDSIRHYYNAISAAAKNIVDHHEKQKFLKTVYETFYKSYNPKAADRLGVVYTPSEIVKFMINSTDYLLSKHFGKSLAAKNVEILDPATGTGTFICDIIEHLPAKDLEYKYLNEIHANEVAILPYYVANLNIEYTYKQKTGTYLEFPNLCFVDTLDNTTALQYEGKQELLFGLSSENAERIKRQNEKKISVIIGNPPYNAKQENYNYQNSNRAYKLIDQRIRDTYVKDGTAQNQIVVYDMYTRFFRWASDRLNEDGIICFITNSSYIDKRTFDGFRKKIEDEFQFAYFIDLGGNIRDLSGKDGIWLNEDNTIFGIAAAVGISIAFLVKDSKNLGKKCKINYIHPCDIRATRIEKLEYLANNPFEKIPFEHITPDKKNNWINQTDNDFEDLIPLIDKDVKAGKTENAIFRLFTSGLKSQRDEWVYDFNNSHLEKKIKYFISVYNKTLKDPENTEKFTIKWDDDLSTYNKRGIKKKYSEDQIVSSIYRPFVRMNLYFDRHLNGRTYQWYEVDLNETQKIICIPGLSSPKNFHTLITNGIIDLNSLPAGCQCMPLLRKGNNDNITDWGLEQFTTYYKNDKITKEDIFYYVYAVLHNPAYREKYELNLKRDFPRIPFYKNFEKWRDWGKTLADLHINYEDVEPYNFARKDEIPKKKKGADDAVEIPVKTKLKADKENGRIYIDEITTLSRIPKAAWEYKLGNRTAIEWVLEYHKERKPKDPTIAKKFNTYRFADYKEEVIELIRKVCTVSIATVEIIEKMKKEKV